MNKVKFVFYKEKYGILGEGSYSENNKVKVKGSGKDANACIVIRLGS